MGLMAVCGMAQETPNTVVITKVSGETIKVAIKDVQDITFAYETPALTVELVDLGLSVKWATCNLGATKPTDAGWYLAWGETSPKTNYTWSTYLSYLGGKMISYEDAGTDKDPLKEYVYGGSHSEGIGETAYDAATANLGADYRMPTQAEFEELANNDNCVWRWYGEGNEDFDGVAGFKITSRKVGYTDKYIFLPAARFRERDDLSYEGSLGYYWSSTSILGTADCACCLYFSPYGLCGQSRNYGFPIRPVSEK